MNVMGNGDNPPMIESAKDFYVPGLMDLTDYRLEPAAADDAWDRFVEDSHQGTVFSVNAFLDPLKARPVRFYVYKNQKIHAAVAAIESTDGHALVRHSLVIHNGLLFGRHDPKMNNAQTSSLEFEITAFTVAELTRRYGRIFLSLSPLFIDIRPFQWHNYHAKGPRFHIDIRYTSFIDFPMEKNGTQGGIESLQARFNKSRRQAVRYGKNAGLRTTQEYAPALFAAMHAETFSRQNADSGIDATEITALLESLHRAGRLRMFVCRTAAGQAGSVTVFALDSKRAYYLFGANDPKLRNAHTGTMVLWNAFESLADEGVRQIDLEGVNSPARGHFKQSFGGALRPYYRLTLGGE